MAEPKKQYNYMVTIGAVITIIATTMAIASSTHETTIDIIAEQNKRYDERFNAQKEKHCNEIKRVDKKFDNVVEVIKAQNVNMAEMLDKIHNIELEMARRKK
jgi:hypothetical protein